MLQATRTSAIRYSLAFAALFIATTFAMSQIVHAIFEVNYTHNQATILSVIVLIVSLIKLYAQ